MARELGFMPRRRRLLGPILLVLAGPGPCGALLDSGAEANPKFPRTPPAAKHQKKAFFFDKAEGVGASKNVLAAEVPPPQHMDVPLESRSVLAVEVPPPRHVDMPAQADVNAVNVSSVPEPQASGPRLEAGDKKPSDKFSRWAAQVGFDPTDPKQREQALHLDLPEAPSGTEQVVEPDVPVVEGGSVAVIITGLKGRFFFNSTLEKVVRPLTESGYRVDLYISLVTLHSVETWEAYRIVPDWPMDTEDDKLIQQRLAESVRGAGGELVSYVHKRGPERLAVLPRTHRNFKNYAPYDNRVGRAVLRRYKSTEELWDLAEAHEKEVGTKYRYALLSRDDAYWVYPVSLKEMAAAPRATDTIWSRACKDYGGLNDKVLLLGRNAAPKMLTAYSAYWQLQTVLESKNSEEFLLKLAELRGVKTQAIGFSSLSSVDSMLQEQADGPPKFCVKFKYFCDEAISQDLVPPFCQTRMDYKMTEEMKQESEKKKEARATRVAFFKAKVAYMEGKKDKKKYMEIQEAKALRRKENKEWKEKMRNMTADRKKAELLKEALEQ